MNPKTTYVIPVIHCNAKALMSEDILKQRNIGRSILVLDWIEEKAKLVNMKPSVLKMLIYKNHGLKVHQEELIKLFGPKVFSVEWVERKY